MQFDSAHELQYDPWGNVREISGADGSRLSLRYDALHQLKASRRTERSTEPDGSPRHYTYMTHYQYDALGRRFGKHVAEGPVGQSEDQNSLHSTWYGWDGDRLVTTQTEQHTRTTVYEPHTFAPLLCIDTQAGSKTEVVENEDLAVLEERGPQENLTHALAQVQQKGLPGQAQTVLAPSALEPAEIALAAQSLAPPVQPQRDQTVLFYHCDHLETPVALIDRSGAIVWQAEFDAWGNLRREYDPQELGQTIRMQGQHYDRETGLFYNRYRYYMPRLGRYVTQDPIGLTGGLNNYIYSKANPLSYFDPLGLDLWGKETMHVYTDRAHNKTSVYEPSNGMTMEFETHSASVGAPGADGPYTGQFTYCERVAQTRDGGAGGGFGPLKWRTTDRRGRWIHGGGSGLPNPYTDARQGWKPTLGCTQAQNEDVKELCEITSTYQKDNPEKRVEYVRK